MVIFGEKLGFLRICNCSCGPLRLVFGCLFGAELAEPVIGHDEYAAMRSLRSLGFAVWKLIPSGCGGAVMQSLRVGVRGRPGAKSGDIPTGARRIAWTLGGLVRRGG